VGFNGIVYGLSHTGKHGIFHGKKHGRLRNCLEETLHETPIFVGKKDAFL
jgi:hypothetical protein